MKLLRITLITMVVILVVTGQKIPVNIPTRSPKSYKIDLDGTYEEKWAPII